MNIEEFATKAIGIPFKAHGREWKEWDCWGLMCKAYKELFNINLPEYKNNYDIVRDRDGVAKLYRKGKEAWTKIEEAKAGDAILIYICGRACHVALAIDNKRMLHVEEGINTCIQRIKDFRVEGIYRYDK